MITPQYWESDKSKEPTIVMTTKRLVITCVAIALAVTSCGSMDSADPDRNAASAVKSGDASASSTPDSVATANTVATSIADAVPQVSKVVDLTEDTDTNNLLGRPNGYQAATVIVDSRTACGTEGPGVACGAVIEQFSNRSAAQRRSDYIQRVLGEAQGLGQEYNTISGPLLLRVSGDLKPSAAKRYEEEFNKAAS